MDFKILKDSRENVCGAGVDNETGILYLCVPSGIADVPAYYPITKEEYHNFTNLNYETLLHITNRCFQRLGENKYKLQWASAYNPLYAIVQKAENDLWYYELSRVQKQKPELYQWDDLIIAAYTDIAAIQKAGLSRK